MDFQSERSFEMLCILKHVKDRSSTLKGCNTMYVKDGKRTHTHIFAHNFQGMLKISKIHAACCMLCAE